MQYGSRYVAVQPERAGKWDTIKTASHLHDVLTDLQTDASGRVNYGRAFGYAWLLAHWPGNPDDRPTVRTLIRHMAKLKRAGLVEVHHIGFRGFNGGMTVRLIGSAKWQTARPAPAVQLSLLLPAVATMKGKPVEKQRKSGLESELPVSDTSVLNRVTDLSSKEVKKQAKETIGAVAAAHAVPRVWKTKKQLDARRRLLLDQADAIQKKFQSAG